MKFSGAGDDTRIDDALFYIKGICPPDVNMKDIYQGIIPFVILQVIAIALVFNWPALATWLPAYVYR